MCSFPGLISEFPNVSVDNFSNVKCSAYFLSHCHSDHMHGLWSDAFIDVLKSNPEVYLYCSNITKLILSRHQALQNVMTKVRELTLTASIRIPPTEKYGHLYEIEVTIIPAGHCPGSVMFLFETATKRILYTGDFRIAAGDTAKFKQFHIGDVVKPIDCMYLDATFLTERYWAFAPRDISIACIIDEIEKWLKKGPTYHIKLMLSAKYGQEAVLQAVAQTLNLKIHVPTAIYDLYRHVPEVSAALTNECSSTSLHAHMKFSADECRKSSTETLSIFPTAQAFQCRRGSKPRLCKLLANNTLKVNYSSHCSLSELEDFLRYLRPKKIVSITKVVQSSEAKMSQTISDIMSTWESVCETSKDSKSQTRKRSSLRPEKPMKITMESSSFSYDDLDELDSSPPSKRDQTICDYNLARKPVNEPSEDFMLSARQRPSLNFHKPLKISIEPSAFNYDDLDLDSPPRTLEHV